MCVLKRYLCHLRIAVCISGISAQLHMYLCRSRAASRFLSTILSLNCQVHASQPGNAPHSSPKSAQSGAEFTALSTAVHGPHSSTFFPLVIIFIAHPCAGIPPLVVLCVALSLGDVDDNYVHIAINLSFVCARLA